MNQGAALDSVNEYGDVDIDSALTHYKKNNLEYLLSVGAPIGKNSLSYAAEYGGVDILTILMNHGANLDCVDEDGNTAVKSAIRATKKDNLEYLNYVLILMEFPTLQELVTYKTKNPSSIYLKSST